uniref:FBA_2 domain-containing protein n=1 Tax=Steinernema glaseri TaxID=37863 RepID=A0A1I7Y4C8_9BILA
MDAVPYKFVDSVVELFGLHTLHRLPGKVRHPRWKPAVELHHHNRVYYQLLFRESEHGIKHIEVNMSAGVGPLFMEKTRVIPKNRRFSRIMHICDQTYEGESYNWTRAKQLGEAETAKLLESILPFSDQVSGQLMSEFGSIDSTRVILTSLFKRVYLLQIVVIYCGQIAYDFVEDQINNSPFLNYVRLAEESWPQSSLKLLSKFCLKGTPGNQVSALVDNGNSYVTIDSHYIQHFLDLWKSGAKLHFKLFSMADKRKDKEWRALMKEGRVTKIGHKLRQSVFQHETEKSLAVVSTLDCLMECCACECDQFEKCAMKGCYPEYHNF